MRKRIRRRLVLAPVFLALLGWTYFATAAASHNAAPLKLFSLRKDSRWYSTGAPFSLGSCRKDCLCRMPGPREEKWKKRWSASASPK